MLNIVLQMWVKDLDVFGFLNYHHFFEKFKSDWTLCKFKGVILFVWRSPLSADETIVRSRTAVIAGNNRCVILSMTQRNAKRDTAEYDQTAMQQRWSARWGGLVLLLLLCITVHTFPFVCDLEHTGGHTKHCDGLIWCFESSLILLASVVHSSET